MARYYGIRIKEKPLRQGEFALRKIIPKDKGALGPKWEGPYKIKKVIRPGSYKLCQLHDDETPLKRVWKGEHLKKYYQYAHRKHK